MLRSKWAFCFAMVALFCLLIAQPSLGDQHNALITAEELKNALSEENLVIIDVRATDAYQAGHIPGAISVQTLEFYEDRDGVKKMAAGPEKFSALLSKIGVTKESRVVVYSAGNDLKHATRLWWVLHMYGHQNAQVLDGGLDAWIASGYETSTVPGTPTPSEYTLTAADVQQDTLATIEEVKAALGGAAIILDARNDDYYQGKKYKAARSGHIAGAILVSASDNLNEDGTYKTADELAQIYAAKSITANTPVITYCNTGTTATIHYFALTQILGFNSVQNYDGSLMEWAADPDLPMESNYDYFSIGSTVAEVNASVINLPVAPFIENSRSFVPADALAKCLGAELSISGDTITLKSGGTTIKLNVGDSNIYTNGMSKKMDVAPVVKDNLICLPIRFVAEACGAIVGWDGEKRVVSINF